MLGRIKITSDKPEVTYENCIEVLQKAIGKHYVNAQKIQELLDFEEGDQPLIREKTYRKDIDCQIVDNIANEIVEFKTGFQYGNPITFKKRDTVEGKIDAVQEWNNQYLLTDSDSTMQELARYFEIGGICCTFVDTNEEYKEGENDNYYIRTVLDPRTSFMIYSSYYPDKREMMGVTYRKDTDGVVRYSCFTKDRRYEIKYWKVINPTTDKTEEFWAHDKRSGEENPLHIIPITEFYRSYDRMGCFERQVDECNNLNLLISDLSNGFDQSIQCVWWTNDCEFETVQVQNEDGTVTEEVKHPKSNEWLQTYTTRDGKIPKVQPLTVNYDYAGILNNIITQRALILQKCNVPQRNDNSGGSTGIAMSDATGWSAAETAASKEEMVISKSLRKEIKVICAAIRESKCPQDAPIRDIVPSDLEPSIKRQKSYELSVKTNAIATLLGQGFSLADTLDAVALFPDPAQVIERSGEGVEKKQNLSEEQKEATPQADDPIYQIGNSPTIDGNSKETVETKVETKEISTNTKE